MRRGAGVMAVAFAGCTAFRADPATNGPSANDGGVTSDGSTESGVDAATIASCPPTISDDFNRIPLIQAPWIGLESESPSMVHIVDGRLAIDTTSTANRPYVLQTGRFVPPAQLACRFKLEPSTDFVSSSVGPPIDLFMYVLRYGDGSRTELRFSYSEGDFTVREDHLSPQGVCAAGECPLAGSPALHSPLAKGGTTELTVAVNLGAASGAAFGIANQTATGLNSPLGNPTSAEIWFGIWSYSDLEQTAQLDDLSCILKCAP